MKGKWGEQFSDSIGRKWKPILAVSIIGAIIGAGVAPFAPKHWQARVLIEIGQSGNNSPMIDPSTVVERIKFPSFATEVISKLGLSEEGNRSSTLIKKTLWASVPRGSSNLVELSVDGQSPEDSVKIASTALSLIQKEHEALLKPATARKEKLLSDYESELKNLSDQRNSILSRLNSTASTESSKFSQNIVLSSIIQSDGQQTRSLNEQVASLREQLDPTRTFNTKAVAPVYVPRRPSGYPVWGCAIAGFLAGLLFGIGLFMLIDSKFRQSFSRAMLGYN